MAKQAWEEKLDQIEHLPADKRFFMASELVLPLIVPKNPNY